MDARFKKSGLLLILTAMVIFCVAVGISIAGNWYDDADETVGTVSVTQLADWMIQGNADFSTLYIATELKKVEGMNNLICLLEDGALDKELAKLPSHKKWVVVTADGNVSQKTINLLGQTAKSGVFLLDGGKAAWEAKIAASSIDGLDIDDQERVALNNVRPFFLDTPNKPSSASRTRVIQPVVAPVEKVDDGAEEEEEGC